MTPDVLNRFMGIAQQYQPHFYCMLSYSLAVMPPKTQEPPIPNRVPFYTANVFSYSGAEGFDPMVCSVQARSLSQLAKELHRALDEAGEGPNPLTYLPASDQQVQTLLALLKDDRTPGPTRLRCFELLLPMLTQEGAIGMNNMLVEHIEARLPGSPAFAAIHGLQPGGQA